VATSWSATSAPGTTRHIEDLNELGDQYLNVETTEWIDTHGAVEPIKIEVVVCVESCPTCKNNSKSKIAKEVMIATVERICWRRSASRWRVGYARQREEEGMTKPASEDPSHSLPGRGRH